MFYLVSEDGLYSFSLGTQDSAKWATGDPPTISYDAGERHVTVQLKCSDGGTSDLEALGEDPPTYYKLRLTSKCACWNGCTGDVNFRKKPAFRLTFPLQIHRHRQHPHRQHLHRQHPEVMIMVAVKVFLEEPYSSYSLLSFSLCTLLD